MIALAGVERLDQHLARRIQAERLLDTADLPHLTEGKVPAARSPDRRQVLVAHFTEIIMLSGLIGADRRQRMVIRLVVVKLFNSAVIPGTSDHFPQARRG